MSAHISDLENRNIYAAHNAFVACQLRLRQIKPSRLFILCDENTHRHCLPGFLQEFPELPPYEVLEVPPGEGSKDPAVLFHLWESLRELKADRQSLLINLGGGVISDLGGFLAATYMRGIPFINFPTSLLAMVDASVGGKTGLNLGSYKNMVGSFSKPLLVGLVPQFLESLPAAELRSGFAEMLKHGLALDADHFRALQDLNPQRPLPATVQIAHSLALKAAVVERDPREKGPRKVLNFGHSLGHALEGYSHQIKNALSHGHAVALGMQAALLLSVKHSGLAAKEASTARRYLAEVYPPPTWPIEREEILALLRHDKKNKAAQLRFVLLRNLGEAVYDIPLHEAQAWEALKSIWHD